MHRRQTERGGVGRGEAGPRTQDTSPLCGEGQAGDTAGAEGVLRALLSLGGLGVEGRVAAAWGPQALAGYELLCPHRKARTGMEVGVRFLRVGGPFAFRSLPRGRNSVVCVPRAAAGGTVLTPSHSVAVVLAPAAGPWGPSSPGGLLPVLLGTAGRRQRPEHRARGALPRAAEADALSFVSAPWVVCPSVLASYCFLDVSVT